MRPNIELHIDELILHGFAPGDAAAIAEAVRLELVRRLAENGAPKSIIENRQIERVDAGAIQVTAGTPPRAVGTQIASAIYSGFSGGDGSRGGKGK